MSTGKPEKHIAIVGAGGHGREIMPMFQKSAIRDQSAHSSNVYFAVEDSSDRLKINGYQVISLKSFLQLDGKKLFNVAIGDGRVRQRIAEHCIHHHAEPFSIIATTAIILDCCTIGPGCTISEQVLITSNIKIGCFFQANCQCTISHDCEIGDYVTIGPGAKCNGNISIGDHAYIGSGAIIREGRKGKRTIIGEGAVVGMGAVVLRDVEPYSIVVGNPARPLRAAID